LPSTSVKLAEIGRKIVVEKHPALARLRRFDEPAPRALAQDSGRQAQEGRRLPQVQRVHDSALISRAS
jgi:hypothetical protein